jgi:hypothetical protein
MEWFDSPSRSCACQRPCWIARQARSSACLSLLNGRQRHLAFEFDPWLRTKIQMRGRWKIIRRLFCHSFRHWLWFTLRGSNWLTNKLKVQHDPYDRKFAVFTALIDFLNSAVVTGLQPDMRHGREEHCWPCKSHPLWAIGRPNPTYRC